MPTSEGLYAQDNGEKIRSLQTGLAKRYCAWSIVSSHSEVLESLMAQLLLFSPQQVIAHSEIHGKIHTRLFNTRTDHDSMPVAATLWFMFFKSFRTQDIRRASKQGTFQWKIWKTWWTWNTQYPKPWLPFIMLCLSRLSQCPALERQGDVNADCCRGRTDSWSHSQRCPSSVRTRYKIHWRLNYLS